MMQHFMRAAVRDAVEEAVNRGSLDDAILRSFRRVLSKEPDRPLTLEGFRMACGEALRAYWPEVPHHEAADWLLDYVGAPFGHPNYGCTYNDAKTLAREYVSDFGEPQP